METQITKQMGADTTTKVSIMIPCWNEEKTIERCVLSCLAQSIPVHQILIIDDSSVDDTPNVLKKYEDRITIVRTPKNSGNKSHAQEFGFQYVTGDIVVTTDADTILDTHFIENIISDFSDPKIAAVSGYVKSLKNNWLTRCRAFEYAISQNIYKLAQSYINYMFVIPGAAGAFRTHIFKEYLTFEHDTITEDLDWTCKLHKNNLKIGYNRKAIVFTQDPSDLHSYINQLRRWYAGGFQNIILKHRHIVLKPAQALEISLMYIEGLLFSLIIFALPLINLKLAIYSLFASAVLLFVISIYASIKEKRVDLLMVFPGYIFLSYINAYIFLEQFVKQVLFQQKALKWFKPERLRI